jgi:4-hydroxybenzoate polyprenyltransferase
VTTVAEPVVVTGRARAFLRLVTIEHSVFALPFAYLAALAAMHASYDGSGGWVRWADLALITVAMVGARTFAMAANRVIDREIDARNPRTMRRELVTGAVAVRTAWAGAGVALAVFLSSAALLNPLAFVLAPLAVVPLVVYPYAKRFTWLPHGVLALAQAVGPVGAWIAVTGRWSWHAVVLGLAVGLWIGGFDLIYACQDVEVDRAIGVKSFPARFGVRAALVASTLTHVVTFALFVWFGALEHFGAWWYAGLAVTAAAFAYEHAIVRPTDLSRVNRAFFTANGFVGIALFAFSLVDLLVRSPAR